MKPKIRINVNELHGNLIPPEDWGLHLSHMGDIHRQVATADPWSYGGPLGIGYTEKYGYHIQFSAMGSGFGVSDVQRYPHDQYDVEFYDGPR